MGKKKEKRIEVESELETDSILDDWLEGKFEDENWRQDLIEAWPHIINAGIKRAEDGNLRWGKWLTELLGIDIKVQTANVGKRRGFAILNRDEFRCFYCGRSAHSNGIELHIDHIHPQSVGGQTTAGNLLTACSECNLSKNDIVLANEPEILRVIAERNARVGLSPDTLIKGIPKK